MRHFLASCVAWAFAFSTPAPLFAAAEPAPAVPPADKLAPRLRAGVNFSVGFLGVANVPPLSWFQTEAQLGLQLTQAWGIYWVGTVGFTGGAAFSPTASMGGLIEYSVDPLSVGAGFERGRIEEFGSGGNMAYVGPQGVTMFGGTYNALRLRFVYHAQVLYGGGGRRHALSLGADLKLMAGDFASDGTPRPSSFAAAPSVWIGYTTF